MDTTSAINNPSIHWHPLFPSARFRYDTYCYGCGVSNSFYGGYFCNEPYCYRVFHKECAEAPLEIIHPSHPEHPLQLTNSYSPRRYGPCDCCGEELGSPVYSCPTCDYNVKLICGIKPSPPAIEHPMCHDHPLVLLKKEREEGSVPCEVCKKSIGGPSYSCLECHVYFHLDCVHLSKEVNHPCHSSHPLKVMASESLTDDDAEKSCNYCSDQPKKVLYHCSICNFTMCLRCTQLPPPLVIEDTKTHTHPLRLISSKIVFTCKVCGINSSDTKPYICLNCDFVVHGDCIGLPQVININRHDHRISFSHHLGHGRTDCGVCRKSVSQYYGAYSCSVCPNYAVHSRCAVQRNVWDGRELEGIPEKCDDIAPFKVVGDNLISHFSHEEHTLRLYKHDAIRDDGYARCEACIGPVVGFGPTYSCEKCRFILHEKCANLPRKKKLVFDTAPYTLQHDSRVDTCSWPCGILFSGFRYTTGLGSSIDVFCGSVSEPFVHDGHSHPLYFSYTGNNRYYCDACKRDLHDYRLRCDDCDFNLCLYCATLPKKIWHRSDEDHPLTLYCGGKASGKNWCEVCERDIDSSIWFFTCSDCGVTFHVNCVLGDFSRLKPELCYDFYSRGEGKEYKAVINNRSTRPFCIKCHSRCKVSVILKVIGEDNGYICSLSCFSRLYFSISQQNHKNY